MKILVICQYYFPEPFRLSDICEELVCRGHEVTVITGLPNYPMGEIYEGYRNGEHREEIIKGVNVHRCYTIGRKHGPIYRFINYYSYMFSSTIFISKLKNDYDVIFVNQLSPVIMTSAAIRYKKRNHKKIVLYCLDLWPESLTLGGVKTGSVIYKYFHRVSERIYRSVDKILVTSKLFSDYFEKQFDLHTVDYLPQYAEAIFTPDECMKVKDTYTDLMFTGNIGVAQSVLTILNAAKLTLDIPNLRWHLVGDGAEFERLKKKASDIDLTNLIFHGRKPLKEMPYYYSMADAMLVTMQNDPIISLTLPGKVQTYMAAGKPIIGAIDGETNRIILESGCGYCSKAEDAESLAKNVRMFIKNNEKDTFSKCSRAYYENHFSKSQFIEKLVKYLELYRG